jgi:hypothetical protein
LPVRNALLANYGPQMLRQGEPVSKLSARFALIYLFHRYALSSAINVIGSAKIPPALAGDGQRLLEIWDPQSQRRALSLCSEALRPDQLEVPAQIWHSLVQYENRGVDPEAYKSSAGYLFSPYDGARSIAEVVLDGLIDAGRLERLESIHHFEPTSPSTHDVLSIMIQSVFAPNSNNDLSGIVQNELADRLMILAADDSATPEVRAEAWSAVTTLYNQVHGKPGASPMTANIARKIEAFIRDPKQNVPKLKNSGAPAGPPI